VADTALAPLPKGRHSLTREQVADAQRLRLAVGLADAMVERGYVGTPVAAILRRARVSRETFYELYDDKLGCFLDALDLVGAVLLAELAAATERPGEPLERAEHAVTRYLATVTEHPAFARLFLVEVHAAGAEAMRRRAALQIAVVDALSSLLGARGKADRFACQVFVAGISALVATPLATGDLDAVAALRRPLIQHLRTLGGQIGAP
jgi:AcrR family transcriptional regulator